MSSKKGGIREEGIFLVVAGPSGVGKTTLCKSLIQQVPGLRFSVSYTTRPPRPSEVHGRDYFFVSEKEFRERIQRGEFAEWAENYGFLYGTSRETMTEFLKKGFDLILDVDTHGARALKVSYPGGIFVFIVPPSWAELEAREGGLVAEESVAGGPWPGVHKGEGGTGKAETILAGGRWSVAGGEESGVRSQESEVGVQGSLDAAANPPATFLLPAFPAPEIPKSRNPQIPLPPSTIHHPSFFSAAWQGAASFFSQEVPFAILVTLGIFAIAGLIGSQITITHPTQFASLPGYSERATQYAAMPGYSAGAAGAARAGGERVPPSPSAPKAPEAPESKIPEVAQITGMVDCEFSDNLAPMHHRIGIGHNNKFALKKGLMEITYFSGARVILQGPCTYEIDSAAGGFLSIGKLTARVETVKPQAANQKSEIINHKSPNPQSPIPNPFVVKTPTAVVTDLGTEFGVEVERSGETFSRVFQGTVAIQWARDGLPVEGAEVRLGANEAARVGREGGRPVVIRSDARAGARSFVRQISRRVVPKLLSLFEFERSCENAAPGAPSGVLRGEAAFVPSLSTEQAVTSMPPPRAFPRRAPSAPPPTGFGEEPSPSG